MLEEIRGQCVVITGATGGLGSAMVEAFLALSAQVFAVARRRTLLDELRAQFHHHEHLQVAECDVAYGPGVCALFDSIERKAPISTVIHTVGAFELGSLLQFTDESLLKLTQTNFVSAAIVLRESLQRMSTRKTGSIVVIGSEGARHPSGSTPLYGATKAALHHLVDAVAQDSSLSAGIRVNAILPGTIDTASNRKIMPNAEKTGWISPQSIAKTAVWLSSSDAAHVRGAQICMP